MLLGIQLGRLVVLDLSCRLRTSCRFRSLSSPWLVVLASSLAGTLWQTRFYPIRPFLLVLQLFSLWKPPLFVKGSRAFGVGRRGVVPGVVSDSIGKPQKGPVGWFCWGGRDVVFLTILTRQFCSRLRQVEPRLCCRITEM